MVHCREAFREEFQKWEVLSLSMVSDVPCSVCIIYIQMYIHTHTHNIKNMLRRLEICQLDLKG